MSISPISRVQAVARVIAVDNETASKRYNTCEGCEEFNPSNNKCKKCGCYMKVKVKFTVSKCPLGKW